MSKPSAAIGRSRIEPAARLVVIGVMCGLMAATAVGAAPSPPVPDLVPADAGGIIAAVKATGARAVLVNVWATWCEPCREEFPDLLKVRRELAGRGLALVLVSGDFEDGREGAVRFLADHGVDFPSFIKTGGDEKFIQGLAPDWSGALPASMVFDGAGRLRHFREGKLTYAQFRDLVLDVLEHPGTVPGKETTR